MKMLFSPKTYAFCLVAIFIGLNACKKDDDIDCPDGQVQHGDHCEDDNELITTLRLVFKNGTNKTTFQYRDVDGPGGDNAQLDTIVLDKDIEYEVNLEILNEAASPAEDISEEIEEEGDQHQFFFTADKDLDLTISYDDEDKNGKPIGLNNVFKTGDKSKGNLLVRLKHQPTGKDGKETTGDTDVEVTFYTIIE